MRGKNMKKIIFAISIFFALFLVFGCKSGGGGPADSGNPGDGGTDGGTDGSSGLSIAVPRDVIISSPTAPIKISAMPSNKPVLAQEAPTDDYETKKEELGALIDGDGECKFTFEQLGSLARANCYGPSIKTKKPGEPEIERPGGDLGIWNNVNLNNPNEACSAAQMNEVVKFAASRVDNFINTLGAIACAGKKAGIPPPTAGSSVTLTSAIAAHATVTGLSITSATLERLADEGSNPVYKFTVNGTMTIDSKTYVVKIITKHIPTSADNSTYKGKISFSYSYTDPLNLKPFNCSDPGIMVPSDGTVQAGMILYEKNTATLVTYEMNIAEFCGADTNPFDSNNNIIASNIVSPTVNNGWANNYNYGLFGINPENGTGSVVSAWQAGFGDAATRSLNVQTEQLAGGATGNGYFGFGVKISESTSVNRGEIQKIYCFWGGIPMASKAQHQALSRTIGATVFGTTLDEIKFAPTDSCNCANAEFEYYKSDLTTMTNDNTDGHAVTNNLIGTSTMIFTRPANPVDVGS